jgi:hypothetical protein
LYFKKRADLLLQAVTLSSKINHVAGYLSCLLAFSLSPAAIALFLGFPWWGKKEKYVALKFLWP